MYDQRKQGFDQENGFCHLHHLMTSFGFNHVYFSLNSSDNALSIFLSLKKVIKSSICSCSNSESMTSLSSSVRSH